MKKKDTETLTRTGAKMIVYRATHMVTIFTLSYIFTGSFARSGALAGLVITLGLLIYYLYDRLWLLIPWKRDMGDDAKIRSVVKTIIYKAFTMVLAFLGTKAVLQFDNLETLLFFIIDHIIITILYFAIERIFNRIGWGKKIEVLEGETV